MSQLLEAWNRGDPEALERLMPLVVDDLRSTARKYFAREETDNTLQPTALVNEVFLRLADQRTVHWEGPRHFFTTAARMMRRLLVDHARHRQAAKRGGGAAKLPLVEEIAPFHQRDPEEIVALDEALERLKAQEPRPCQVVELKYFVGLTIAEIAETLEVRPTTVKSDWRIARAWLLRELRYDPEDTTR